MDELNGRPLQLPDGDEWFESLALSRRPYATGELDQSKWRLPARSKSVEFVVAVMIRRDGHVVAVQSFGEDRDYEDAVVAALTAVAFTPGEINGAPVNSILLLSFTFSPG